MVGCLVVVDFAVWLACLAVVGLSWFVAVGWVDWLWDGLVGFVAVGLCFGWVLLVVVGWFGLVWFGLVWFGLVWFGLV